MEEIKCEILQGEVLSKSYGVFTAEVLEGSISSVAGMIMTGFRMNDKRFNLPVSFFKWDAGLAEQIKLYFDLRLTSEGDRQIIANTKFGTIRMQAPDRAVSLHGNKHLLFIDSSGILQAFPVLLALAELGGQLQLYSMNQSDNTASEALRAYAKRMDISLQTIRGDWEKKVARIAESQTVGTRIMTFCDWSIYKRVKRIARQAGYSNEEIQGYGFGEKEESVFCARCYRMQLKPNESEMTCVQCGAALIVSDHYSPRLEAFIGYIHVTG
ncbi:dimethylamine monooxygenase subunit DmmA family protein [Cohnella sp.]|uniref:dimethylamine monooxygenase subunit DmmA family protein n=1 Tax=Cohnella sp. TaxID=1883426 RepID=UPI00356AF627